MEFIISFTSYPARIKTVNRVIESILNTKVDKSLYKIVLSLSIEEFPNKENDLPDNLLELFKLDNVELLWHPTNIRSHKKIIPVLKKYPNASLLLIDDDIERNTEWLQMFVDDHRKYPNSIITMRCDHKITKNLDSVLDQKSFKEGIKPYGIIYNFRPANGCGGILYPAGTFTDERFFDEELMMKLSPSSDEMWQFCFNVMYDQEIRRSSKFFEVTCIPGTQTQSLESENRNKYNTILKTLLDYFPLFKEKLYKRVNSK